MQINKFDKVRAKMKLRKHEGFHSIEFIRQFDGKEGIFQYIPSDEKEFFKDEPMFKDERCFKVPNEWAVGFACYVQEGDLEILEVLECEIKR